MFIDLNIKTEIYGISLSVVLETYLSYWIDSVLSLKEHVLKKVEFFSSYLFKQDSMPGLLSMKSILLVHSVPSSSFLFLWALASRLAYCPVDWTFPCGHLSALWTRFIGQQMKECCHHLHFSVQESVPRRPLSPRAVFLAGVLTSWPGFWWKAFLCHVFIESMWYVFILWQVFISWWKDVAVS